MPTLLMVMLALAAPTHAQTRGGVTIDQHKSIAEVGAGVAIQGPGDANQSARTYPAFAVTLTGTVYPADVIGIEGELAAFRNPWGSYAQQINRGRTALVGLKLRTHLIKSGTTNWRLFAEMLGGPQWTDVTSRRHVLQPGVGADDYLRNGVTLHVEYGYTF